MWLGGLRKAERRLFGLLFAVVLGNEWIEWLGLKFGLHFWIMSDACLLQSARLMVVELNGCSLFGDGLKAERRLFGLLFVVVFGFLMLLLKLRGFGLLNVEGLAAVLFGLKLTAFGRLFCCMLWFLKLR
jgi:hypothetical protein